MGPCESPKTYESPMKTSWEPCTCPLVFVLPGSLVESIWNALGGPGWALAGLAGLAGCLLSLYLAGWSGWLSPPSLAFASLIYLEAHIITVTPITVITISPLGAILMLS